MSAGRAVLDPVDVEDGGTELDLIPAKVAQFRRSTAVPESDHYPGSIPVPVPVRLGGLDQALDLAAVNCSRVQGRRAGALSGQLFDLYEQPPSRHEVGAPGARTGLNARRSSRAGSSLWLPRPQRRQEGPDGEINRSARNDLPCGKECDSTLRSFLRRHRSGQLNRKSEG